MDIDADAVEQNLKRKLTVYKANGDAIRAANVQEILKQGIMAVKATVRPEQDKPRHPGRVLKLGDPRNIAEVKANENETEITPSNFKAVMERMASDPVYAAMMQHRLRKPKRVSRSKHGIAGRAAIREPMLNADPQSIRNALEYHEPGHKDRVRKHRVYTKLVITPGTLANAKAGRKNAFWEERLWYVYSIMYASGFIIVDDMANESRVFPTIGEVKSAIRKSGWNIVREVE